MNTSPLDDPLLQSLRRLPAVTPETPRDERTRQRCHAALAEHRRRLTSRRPRLEPRWFEAVLVTAFGLVYLAAVLYDASRVYW